jgi:hypothetical protein
VRLAIREIEMESIKFPNRHAITLNEGQERLNRLMNRPNRSEASDNELDELSDAIDMIRKGQLDGSKVKREAGNTDPRGWYMVERGKGKQESVVIGKDIPEEYMCPISGEMMEDPVMTKNGHNYERKEIEDFKKHPVAITPSRVFFKMVGWDAPNREYITPVTK